MRGAGRQRSVKRPRPYCRRPGLLRPDSGQVLVKTLACKLKISCTSVYRQYQTVIPTEDGPRKVLRVTVARDRTTAA